MTSTPNSQPYQQSPIAFLAPTSKKPQQPPGDIVWATARPAAKSKTRNGHPSPNTVGRNHGVLDDENPPSLEEAARDEGFSFQERPQQSGKKTLLGKDGPCGDRPVCRNLGAIVTDLLLLLSGILFFQESISPDSSRNSVGEDYAFVCFIIAGVCEMGSLLCALLTNFRKNRTFTPFIGVSLALLGIVSGFCAGILSDDLDRASFGMGSSLAAFLGFFILGVSIHGGMSLRKPPATGLRYINT